jgi:hypothetical protein
MVSLIFGVLEVCAHNAKSERSILDETLEGTLCGTPLVPKVVLSGTTFACRLPHKNGMWESVFYKMGLFRNTSLINQKKILVFVGASVESCT